ncbi:MAG: hypothetical protein ACREPY_06965 [Rhodanobacteraceae bacterium]
MKAWSALWIGYFLSSFPSRPHFCGQNRKSILILFDQRLHRVSRRARESLCGHDGMAGLGESTMWKLAAGWGGTE